MNDNRKLAAILFADIAGYTNMMQKDEERALNILNHFRKDIETIVPEHGGEIVQFYGDGCLLIFNSVIIAMKCAIALQESLKKEPLAPVRIGIHQGDIIQESGNIFGNSVNIAARIESMSIPGAILVSEKAASELKNQRDIQLKSLGKFEFKNVQHPIEVLALDRAEFPIPKKGEIKGKFKEQNKEKSIAVLAFENRSSDPEQEYFAEGVAEEIMYGLSKLDNLRVAGRASSFSFKESSLNLQEIADQLQVETVLSGSVRKMGNRLRVSAQLVDGLNGFQIWTERYDKELEDVFTIQDEIAEQVVKKMELTLLGKERRTTPIQRKTENIQAYQSYLQGKSYLDQRINILAALSCFEKAIDIDPDFAAAYNSKAYAHFYSIIFAYIPSKVGFPSMESAILKALSLDSSNAESYTLRALVDFYFYQKFESAISGLEEAILLQPQLPDTYRIKAYLHSMLRQYDEAIQCIETAYQLDPISFNINFSKADIYYRARKFDKALEIYQPLKDKYPENETLRDVTGTVYFAMGKKDLASAIFQEKLTFTSTPTIYSFGRYLFAIEEGNKTLVSDFLQHIEKLNEHKWVPPTVFAILLYLLEEMEAAEIKFQEAFDEKDPSLLGLSADPLLHNFYQEPFGRKLLDKLGFH